MDCAGDDEVSWSSFQTGLTSSSRIRSMSIALEVRLRKAAGNESTHPA